jgi:hypothetical protein
MQDTRTFIMRITLAIDDDILAAASHLAERDRKSMGEVISALARQCLARGPRLTRADRSGIPRLPSRRGAALVTPGMVSHLRDGLS